MNSTIRNNIFNLFIDTINIFLLFYGITVTIIKFLSYLSGYNMAYIYIYIIIIKYCNTKIKMNYFNSHIK